MARAEPGRDGWFECVVKDQFEIESWRELALEVIHEDPPSRNASMSSVAKDGRGFST